jgi:hypothetical protein
MAAEIKRLGDLQRAVARKIKSEFNYDCSRKYDSDVDKYNKIIDEKVILINEFQKVQGSNLRFLSS